ncbi:DMT family transporter [Streptomyces sp. NPDC047108]|uniref:DMT family transporter n=1 Tax=Streptomyces sp. NPDC047108 TaxID=3155025 RepID=UPI0033D6B35F
MWWGVAAALMANVLYSTGFVLEKRALAGLPPLSAGRPARAVRLLIGSPLWIGGSLALALGFAAQLAVYRTLPIVAAQGLFVSGLVLLLLLSSLVLGERPTGRERRGVAVITVALAMVVASLHGSAEAVSRSAPTGTLLALCVPSLAAGLWLYGSAERRTRRRHRLPTTGVEYGVAVGLLYGVSSLAVKGVSGLLDRQDIGGAARALITSPYPYLLLVTGATGLVLSQTALQRCRASLIVPVCTTVTCVFTATSGSFAFGEPLPHDPVRLALRLGGTALAVTVLLMLPRHEAEPPGSAAASSSPTGRATGHRSDTATEPTNAQAPATGPAVPRGARP